MRLMFMRKQKKSANPSNRLKTEFQNKFSARSTCRAYIRHPQIPRCRGGSG